MEEVKKLCIGLRRNAKVFFFLDGHHSKTELTLSNQSETIVAFVKGHSYN